MVIARLQQYGEAQCQEIVEEVLAHFNGKLPESERAYLQQRFRLLTNRLLHAPISALHEESQPSEKGHTLLEALRKLFRLEE